MDVNLRSWYTAVHSGHFSNVIVGLVRRHWKFDTFLRFWQNWGLWVWMKNFLKVRFVRKKWVFGRQFFTLKKGLCLCVTCAKKKKEKNPSWSLWWEHNSGSEGIWHVDNGYIEVLFPLAWNTSYTFSMHCNVTVTIMCADRTEWSGQSEGTITLLHTWWSTWPPSHYVNTGVKKETDSLFKIPW